MRRMIKILSDQRGMETVEAISFAVIGLITVALLYNATKSGINTTSNKVGNTMNTIGAGNTLPNQLNP